MNTALECIPCFVRQATEVVEMSSIAPPGRERLLRLLLRKITQTSGG